MVVESVVYRIVKF